MKTHALPFKNESEARAAVFDLAMLKKAREWCERNDQIDTLSDFIMKQALFIGSLDAEANKKMLGDSPELRFVFAVSAEFDRIAEEVGREPVPPPLSIIGYWMQALEACEDVG
jgi:hypothetical protein